MPPVYLKSTLVDLIMEAVSILLVVAAWTLAIVLFRNLQNASPNLFFLPITITLVNILLLWSGRAPIRYYNFPVKLNEQNYVMQYFIASRYIRVLNLIVNVTLLCSSSIELEPLLDVKQGLFHGLTIIAGGILFVSFIVYYIIAYRYR